MISKVVFGCFCDLFRVVLPHLSGCLSVCLSVGDSFYVCVLLSTRRHMKTIHCEGFGAAIFFSLFFGVRAGLAAAAYLYVFFSLVCHMTLKFSPPNLSFASM